MSTSTGYNLLQELAILSQGRRPAFLSQTQVLDGETPAIPSLTTDGIDTTDAILTDILVKIRREAHTHSVWVGISTYVATETYTVTIAGTDYDEVSGGSDTIEDVLTALAATIDGVSGYAAVYDSDDSMLKITGDTEVSYTSAVSSTGATAMTHIADATTCDFALWLLPSGRTDWIYANNTTFSAVTVNVTDRFTTSGYDRVFVKVSNHDGRVEAVVGPCLEEA